MECKDCDFYKEVGPGWVCTDEEDWRNNGDPCCRYHPNASLTLFEGVTKEAHDKLKEQHALLAAENERLRDALGEIANWCGRPSNIKCNECGSGHWPHCHELVMIARKAMEGRDERSDMPEV